MPRTTAIILITLSLLAFSPLVAADNGVDEEHRDERSDRAPDDHHRTASSSQTSEAGEDDPEDGDAPDDGGDGNETTDPENGTADGDNATVPPQHIGFQAEDSGPVGYLDATADLVPDETSTALDVHLVLTLQGETGVPDVDEALGNATAGTPAEDLLGPAATVQVDAGASLPGSGGL